MLQITKQEIKIIPGTFDPVFKEIFTSPDCHNYVCTLISHLTNINQNYLKENLKVINNNLPKKRAKEKTKETDILLSVEGHIINIEMNKNYYEGLFEKNDMYQHTILSRSMRKGQSYKTLKKVIQINIDNFTKFKKAISVFKLMEIDTHEIENESYLKYHISLPIIMKKYYNKDKLSYLEKLLLLIGITRQEELEELSKGDKVLMEAKKKIEDLSLDELYSDLYDVEQDRIMEENAKREYAEKIGMEKGMKQGMEQGIKEGLEKGLEQGIEKGKKENSIEIAIQMLKDNLDNQTISKYTGLTIKELENLNKN